jgi:RND family efflux transporter MFP subunit
MIKDRKLIIILLPIIIILCGIVIMKTLVAIRPEQKKEVRVDPGILVQLLEVKKTSVTIVVNGTGTVTAAEEVSINPQVSGRIIRVSPDLVVGGFFRKDEILFEIEDTDYRLALDRANAARAKAEYDFATIESQSRVARSEWERLNRDNQEQPNPLVLFEPQLKNAVSALSSAGASIKQAVLDLERTKIAAPFNCRVRSESIDPGQYVKSGSSVAVLAGTDYSEVLVPLPLEDLQWLIIPRSGDKFTGSSAVVSFKTGEKVHEWQGRVVRSTGEVDPKTRMMKLVVLINDPYGLKGESDTTGPALAQGAFVEVRFMGTKLENMFVIPRSAFRDASTVWIMDKEEKLRIREVVTERIKREKVIISEGLAVGDRVILTNISGAANGMRLRAME